jgi:hypothetical protein
MGVGKIWEEHPVRKEKMTRKMMIKIGMSAP